MSSSPTLSPTEKSSNLHESVGADGNTYVDIRFTSEPLGISAEQGFGFPQLEFNQAIGPDGRYIILRKLGWGSTASIWLARDKTYVQPNYSFNYHHD